MFDPRYTHIFLKKLNIFCKPEKSFILKCPEKDSRQKKISKILTIFEVQTKMTVLSTPLLVAASLASTILNWREHRAVLIRITTNRAPFAFAGKMLRITKLLAIIAFALLDVGLAAFRRYHDHDVKISVVAHVFGALTGFLIGFTLLRDEKEDPCEKYLKFICWSVFCVCFGLALGINIVGSRLWVGFWSYEGPQ